MDNEQEKPERDPAVPSWMSVIPPKQDLSHPLTVETVMYYQDKIGDGSGIRVLGYKDATDDLLPILKQLEKAKSFTAMKKQLTAFRKDREKFYRALSSDFEFDGQSFQPRKPN